MSGRIAVVLVGTTHPGNLGAVARAMKTMGLDDLRLVSPECAVDDTARATAVHAEDLLESARHHDTITAALDDCHQAYALSARTRRVAGEPMLPRAAAEQAVTASANGPVALVFGREHSGLYNDEIAHCHGLVHIPTNPDYSSLNLAAAVQIMAYEVRLAQGEQALPPLPRDAVAPLASARHLESFYHHLETVIERSGYAELSREPYLMQRVRRLVNRARPEAREVNILRGLLVAVERALSRR